MSTTDLGNLSGTQNYTGSIDSADLSDWYNFSLNKPGSFSVSLANLSANADVRLLDSNGTVLYSSFLAGTSPEAINADQLAAGDYLLQVLSAGENTNYQLNLTVDPLTGLSVESGFFTVGESGQVGIDFLFDGGSYEGEIAIFSLKGMAAYNAGSPNFIKEAARRALSNSVDGYIVLDDSTQGAKLSARLPWESNFNRGEYQGIKTFAMTPGEEFGIMLVPTGKVQEVFDNPNIGGEKRPLFSLATANPLEGFQVGQIADVTGDGRTFVMEDVRIDIASDKDYNDIVFRVTGAKGIAKTLDELINPDRDWRTEEIGEELRDAINTAPQGLQFITQEIYTAGETISLTDGKVLDENGDLTKVQFWLKKDIGEWVDIGDATNFSAGIEGWTAFNYALNDLSAGNYQLKAIAIDELGKTSNEVIQSFRVNAAPIDLEFNLSQSAYKIGESVNLTGGKVYDADGVADLAKVSFWVRSAGSEWTQLADVTNFTAESEKWATFNYSLTSLAGGSYEVKAIAYDLAGDVSNEVIQSFQINEPSVPTTNTAPQELQFNIQSSYAAGEPIILKNSKVFDANGISDVAKVEIWLQKDGDQWLKKSEITQFTADSEGWATFNDELTELAAGTYQLKAVAYDQLNAASNEVLQSFTITGEPAVPPSNTAPQFLQFNVQPYYQVGEIVGVSEAKVYDANGAGDIKKVYFRLQKDDDNWQEIGTVQEFDSNDEGWGNFNYSFGNLAAGNYQLEAVAYDEAGNASNKFIQKFTVLTADVEVPGNPNFNRPPEDLKLSIFPLYTNKETISFSGAKVYDKDGYNDIKRIDFKLQKPTGEWVDINDVTEFTVDNKDWTRFDFSYDLTGLAPGKYQLWAVAYDEAGNASNIASEYFSIITDSGEGELSDAVRLAIARSANLENYNSDDLARTREWVVWITPGQSSKDLANRLGAINLGETGHIPNTYTWAFAPNTIPNVVANQLGTLPGVEFAYPLVPLQPELLYKPNDELFDAQWHLSSKIDSIFDTSVAAAWDQNVRGRGVVIGIVDDGLQGNHPDLQGNYLSRLSLDLNEVVGGNGTVYSYHDRPLYQAIRLNDTISWIRTNQNYVYDKSPEPTYKATILTEDEKPIVNGGSNQKFPLDVSLTGIVKDVNVWFDNIQHTNIRDLSVSLYNPSTPVFDPRIGTASSPTRRSKPGEEGSDSFFVELFKRLSKSTTYVENDQAFYQTLLDEQPGLQLITQGTQPYTGTFRPLESKNKLTDFNESWGRGIWNLNINDEWSKSGGGGQVNSWGLEVDTYNPHGTAVAGVAAARGNNSIGGSGVAPEAGIVGLRLLADEITDKQIADALSYQFNQIDIYNNSWKLEDQLNSSPLYLETMDTGSAEGRGGLGSIYVFGAGNSGKVGGNVNYNGLANSRYAITVAAINSNGEQTSYSEPGAPVFISAYSSEGTRGITTTDLSNHLGYTSNTDQPDYTSHFGGTSAAAPFVSGTIALMLEANPRLTWRDIQHILVSTAQKNDLEDLDWAQNKAGIWINHKYGFGAINPLDAVKAASDPNWMPVAGEDSFKSALQNVHESITDGEPSSSTIKVGKDLNVEKVEVVFNAQREKWNNLRIILTSPSGTESMLAVPHEISEQGHTKNLNYDNWIFTSVRHWGESSQGEWKLEVFDEKGNQLQDEWDAWKLNIYGTAPEPTVTIRATDATATEDGKAAQFVVTRDGDLNAPLTVNYAIGGTATNGIDYKQLTGSVTIGAGKTSATIGAVPNLDYLIEGDETVTLTLRDTNTYNLGIENRATATITNTPPTDWYGPFVYENPANGHLYILSDADTWLGAQEQAEALGGNLVAINDAAEQDWIVDTFGNIQGFWVGVTDSEIYGATEGNYKWVNGEALTYTNWTPGEPNNIHHPWSPEGENFGEMYPSGPWNDSTYFDPSTVDANRLPQPGIIEIDPASLTQPIVNLHVTDSQTGEDGNAGQILIQRIGKLDEDLTVNYTVAGSAINGVDYQELSGTATIAAGSSIVTIPINTLVDDELSENEKITVNLAAGNYEIGTKPVGEVVIADQHPITRIGKEVIGRNVDVPYWTQRWQNGETLEQLRIAIIEAANDGQGNYEAETKIKEIYQDVLGREAEDAEVANWRSRLEAGATLSQIHQELQGQEFIPSLNYVYTNPANGHRYVLTPPDTWLGAQEQAKTLGGNLVTINDANENQWLVDTFGNVHYWMGLTDSPIYKTTEGNYKWVNGDLVTLTNWYPGQPDNFPFTLEGEDFSDMNFWEASGQWNDMPQLLSWIRQGIVEIEPAAQEDTKEPTAIGVVTMSATPI